MAEMQQRFSRCAMCHPCVTSCEGAGKGLAPTLPYHGLGNEARLCLAAVPLPYPTLTSTRMLYLSRSAQRFEPGFFHRNTKLYLER